MSNQTNLGTGDAFSSVLSTLQNQRRRLDVISTNISNINTIGFKSSRMTFLEMLGKTVGKLYTPFEQGSFTSTGSVTDVAIQGRSFFVIRNGDDEQYTRAGSFYFNQDGTLVNQDRLPVQGWTLDETIEDVNDISFGNEVGKLGAIGDIVLDPELTVGALPTQNVYLGGNLDAGDSPVTNILEASQAYTYDDGNGNILEAELATKLNDLAEVGTDLVDGDIIDISGSLPDGTTVSGSFIYDVGSGSDDVQALVDSIQTAFGPTVIVGLTNGKITITDTESGDSESSITLMENSGNTGEITVPSFVPSADGYTPKASTSIIVYDSFGTAHHLTVDFVKTANEREWSWTVDPQGNESISRGGSGHITFDEQGNFASMSYDDASLALYMDPGNGAANLELNLHAGGEAGISGITQFDAAVSLGARHQDGQASGKLEGITVDDNGYIIGTFSNGVIKTMAQLAVAEFDDPTSLDKSGSSNFIPTNLSGEAVIGRASEFDTILMSGHLEQSNVDLADQFIQMIDAQKGYQAASRIVSTLDRVLEETTRFGR